MNVENKIENKFEPRVIGFCNWIGLVSLVKKEVGRFLNVYMQTIIAPIITMVLFFAVFALSLHQHTDDVAHDAALRFLAPGLLMMTMIQNGFANSSSSLMIAKLQGNIVDILMPPLAPWELLAGMLIGALFRCFLIGVLGVIVLSLFVTLPFHSVATIFWFGLLGNMILTLLGIMTGIWAENFDKMTTISNFIVTPLTFLSGTFYSIASLPPVWQKAALFNPFFYMIDGFRAGFTGVAETNLLTGSMVLCALCVLLILATWTMWRTGYKTKS